MPDVVWNIALVFLFIVVGGLFAASELALVSLRDSQVRAMANQSGAGARVARLLGNSNRFLSSVQVGVTLAGFFSASYGAAQIAPQLSPSLVSLGMSEGGAGTVAFIGTTVVISYLSLVFGELVPKRLAMQSAERFSLVVATPLDWVATLLRPVIWLLGASTDLVMRLLGRDPNAQREEIGAEELRSLVAEHESIGVVERAMVMDLLAVGERGVEEVMTPRTEVEFFDSGTTIPRAQQLAKSLEHSRYPVRGENDDDILGFVHVRDLIAVDPGTTAVAGLVRHALFFPTGTPCLAVMTEMRAQGVHLAIVVDEYGGTDGIVTLEDIVEEFVGEIQDEYDRGTPDVVNRDLGGDVSGLLSRAEAIKAFHRELPAGPFDTLAGFLTAELGRMAEVGDSVGWDGLSLTVSRLDGRRIDRVDVRPEPGTTATADGGDEPAGNDAGPVSQHG